MRNLIWGVLVLGSTLFTPHFAISAPVFDYNAGSGTNFPGWTWFPNGADDYGNPGWRKNDGQFLSGGTDWKPRQFMKADCGGSTLATIDTAERAPSTASGGSLKVYNNSTACWWWIMDDNYGRKGFANATTNRWSYYVKYAGAPDPGFKSSDPDGVNIEIGTYLFPDGHPEAGQEIGHWYHQMAVSNGAWLHVLLDRHPQHERGSQVVPKDNPAGSTNPYYQKFITFYFDVLPYNFSAMNYWIDEIEWYTELNAENDISISTVWVGYWAGTDTWQIQFKDSSWGSSYNDNAVGTYEIRYAAAPITNATWNAATPITPLHWATAGSGRIRRPNPWKDLAWTDFTLPNSFESANGHIYFAIKDVSSTANGDNHNSPSSDVKTIDYWLKLSGDKIPPLAPTGLTVK